MIESLANGSFALIKNGKGDRAAFIINSYLPYLLQTHPTHNVEVDFDEILKDSSHFTQFLRHFVKILPLSTLPKIMKKQRDENYVEPFLQGVESFIRKQ